MEPNEGRRRGPAIWVLALALGFYASAAEAQTLSEELNSLAQTHPAIQAKEKSLLAAEEEIRGARSGYFPTVKLTGDSGPEYVDSPSRRSTEGHAFLKGRETAGLSVTQKVFDGFKTDSQVEEKKRSYEQARLDLASTRSTTLLEGTKAYIDVLRYTKLIALARETERKTQDQLNLEDERVQKGAGIASDVLAAKQRLQIAKENRVNYEGLFEAAVAAYAQVFGHSPDVSKLSDPPVLAASLPDSLDQASTIAERENLSVLTAAKRIEVSDERKNTAEADYYPTLDLVGKSNYENDKNATVGVRRDWSLLLQATWELFSGFKTQAAVAKATLDIASNKDDLRNATRKAQQEVQKAWHSYRNAKSRLELLENAAVLAEELWEAAKKKREAGKANVQDVLDEETKINDARIKYTTAYYDMIVYSYDLLAAIGRLDGVGGNPQPSVAPVAIPAVAPAPGPVPAAPPASTQPPPPAPAPKVPVQREGRSQEHPLQPRLTQPILEERVMTQVQRLNAQYERANGSNPKGAAPAGWWSGQ